jgi:hypothetical protein
MRRLLIGAIAGLTATIPMTIVIVLGRGLRLLWTPPPKQITKRIANRAGVHAQPSSDEFKASWVAAHFAYGAGCGSIYSLARPMLPGPVALKGLIFGETVWAVSYLGFVPALGLYPWPKDDSKSRMAVMIAAHAVYGLVTAQNELAFSRIDEGSDCYVTIQPPNELVSRRA